ncbi:hypothetical protein CSUI_006804, partial [Cystoisospora suis]
ERKSERRSDRRRRESTGKSLLFSLFVFSLLPYLPGPAFPIIRLTALVHQQEEFCFFFSLLSTHLLSPFVFSYAFPSSFSVSLEQYH